MTGRLRQGARLFSAIMSFPLLWDCQTRSAQVSSCATEGYAGRTAGYKPAPFDASVALNTGECLKVAQHCPVPSSDSGGGADGGSPSVGVSAKILLRRRA